jgi:hypothetical protein
MNLMEDGRPARQILTVNKEDCHHVNRKWHSKTLVDSTLSQ